MRLTQCAPACGRLVVPVRKTHLNIRERRVSHAPDVRDRRYVPAGTGLGSAVARYRNSTCLQPYLRAIQQKPSNPALGWVKQTSQAVPFSLPDCISWGTTGRTEQGEHAKLRWLCVSRSLDFILRPADCVVNV